MFVPGNGGSRMHDPTPTHVYRLGVSIGRRKKMIRWCSYCEGWPLCLAKRGKVTEPVLLGDKKTLVPYLTGMMCN